MQSAILDHLRAEEAELSTKLDAIRSVIALYAPSVAQEQNVMPIPVGKPAQSKSDSTDTAPVKVRKNDYAVRIREIAREVIATSPSLPVATRIIVDEVQAQGVEIRGQNSLNAVSALLSRNGEFVSNGRLGWTLAQAAEEIGESAPRMNEAPTVDHGGASDTGEVGGGTPSNPSSNPSPAGSTS